MSSSRKVGFYQGLKYRGGSPMLAWMLHRITGVGIILFVGLHVVASFMMQQFGSDLATNLNIIYESWMFQIVISFFVIFHAFNGLRIVAQDIWPQLQRYQLEALWLEWAVFLPVYGLAVYFIVIKGLSGA
jgi:succinate dehydrogenase / fumarate reductase cytochrome b subunit